MLKRKFFYPLYNDFDKKLFTRLQQAINNRYSFIGDTADKIYFIKTLLYFQMIKDYRAPLKIIVKYLDTETKLADINKETKKLNFESDFSWVVWTRDKIMTEKLSEIYQSQLKFAGTDEEFSEFVLRYLLSILLAAWEGPLFAITEALENKEINLRELNEVLKLWDFTGEFVGY